MQGKTVNILTVNILFSTLTFWVAAGPISSETTRTEVQAMLPPILLLHSFRHLGLMFLAPGAPHAGIPQQFEQLCPLIRF
jgi:hypothetical protein